MCPNAVCVCRGEERLLQSSSVPGNLCVYVFNNLIIQLHTNVDIYLIVRKMVLDT